jgi:hypothetical protein
MVKVGLDGLSHIVNRLARDSDLACRGRSRFTLATFSAT